MKMVLIYSGGMDSTVLLYRLLSSQQEVFCLGINYGQRHVKELSAATSICRNLGVDFKIADLSGIRNLLGGSSQTSDIGVPEGHYAEESMKLTVVPNRNMIMLSVAVGWAISLKADHVAYAAHAGDHTIYPDCRPEFAEALNNAVDLCDWHHLSILRPFIEKTKADICRLGADLGVPFEKTWSCYKGLEKHCGKCGTDVERKEAFRISGVIDLTEYVCEEGAYRG